MRFSELLRTKVINAGHDVCTGELRRMLGPLDLTLLGIGIHFEDAEDKLLVLDV